MQEPGTAVKLLGEIMVCKAHMILDKVIEKKIKIKILQQSVFVNVKIC